jgi:hypothetical protein
VRRLLGPLLGVAALAACGHAQVAAPPPRPLTTSTAATPELKEGAGREQGGAIDADTQAAIDHGIAQGQGGDLDGARRTFQAVVERNPNTGPAWVNLGVIAERKGDLKEAETSYRRAAQCTVAPPESWDFLARLLVRTKRAAEAEQLLRGAAQQQPDELGPRNAPHLGAAGDQPAPRGRGRVEEGPQGRRAERAGDAAPRPGLLPPGQVRAVPPRAGERASRGPEGPGDPQRAGHGPPQAEAAAPPPWTRSRPPPRSARTSPRLTATSARCWSRAGTTTAR